MAGGKIEAKRSSKRQKSGVQQQLQPPTIQAFDRHAQEYFQKYPQPENQILYQEKQGGNGEYMEDHQQHRMKSGAGSKSHQTLTLKKAAADKSKYKK